MVSVPDWTTDGYTFQSDGPAQRGLLRKLKDALRRLTGRPQPAPPAPKSLVYVLCEEYRHLELWSAYHAFRLDPRAHTWQRLRRQSVPWQSEHTVEGLVQRLCPWYGKRTPDANAVGFALVTAPSASAAPSKKKR